MDLCYETLGIENYMVIKNIYSDSLPLINKSKAFYHFNIVEHQEININSQFIFGITNTKAKKAVHQFFNDRFPSLNFINILHPTAYISSSTQLSKGVVIEPLVAISSQSEIEFGVNVKRGCNVGHHTNIGKFTTVNPGCTISGNVNIGEGCTIGSGAVIRDSISIGDNAVIGLGSVVTKDIPANVEAYGNPCQVIKKL